MTDISSRDGTLDDRTLGYVAGALMIFFAPAGVILSYIDRSKSTPLLTSHYNYLIGTFWKGMLFFFISGLLTFLVIGIFGTLATFIWYLIRCVKSLVYLHRGDAIANPRTWLF